MNAITSKVRKVVTTGVAVSAIATGVVIANQGVAQANTLTPIFNDSTNGATVETIDKYEGYTAVRAGGVDSYGTAFYKTPTYQCMKYKYGSNGTWHLAKDGWNYTNGNWTDVVAFNC